MNRLVLALGQPTRIVHPCHAGKPQTSPQNHPCTTPAVAL